MNAAQPITLATQRSTLRACCSVHVLHDGLVDMMYALLPVLAQALGLSLTQVGMIRGANSLANAALQIPAGLLAERVGPALLLLLGGLLAGASLLGLAYADSFGPVLIATFLAGAGSAVQHPLSSTLLTTAFSKAKRPRALGTYNMFGDIGKFSFIGVVLLAMAAGFSWRAPVMFFGIAAIGVSVATWMMLSGFHSLAGSSPSKAKVNGVNGWGILNPRSFTALGIIASLDSATRTAFLTFIAFLMIEKQLPLVWAGAAVMITLFGGMLGKFACGLLNERFGAVKTIGMTEVATALGIVAVILLPGTLAFLALPLVGVVLNGTSSVTYASVSELVDDTRHARAYGLIYTIGSMCGVISPLVFGVIADRFGLTGAFITMSILVCVTLPLLPFLGLASKPMKPAN